MINDETRPTQDHADIMGQPCCFKCERPIKCGIETKDPRDYWESPWGLTMTGGTNFGSSLYDAMIDGIFVNVLICDECLVQYKHLLREVINKSFAVEVSSLPAVDDDVSAMSNKSMFDMTNENPANAKEIIRNIIAKGKNLKMFELDFLVDSSDLGAEIEIKILEQYGDDVLFIHKTDKQLVIRFKVCSDRSEDAVCSLLSVMNTILPDMMMKFLGSKVIQEEV
jgi:hypothetical protein